MITVNACRDSLKFHKIPARSSSNPVCSAKTIVPWIQWSSWTSCEGSSWCHLESAWKHTSGHIGVQRDLSENGRPTQSVNDIVPWSWWPNWIKRRKGADANIHLCLRSLKMWCHQSPAATPFQTWWAVSAYNGGLNDTFSS